MSLRIAARLARRELRGGLRGFGIFLSCLALGVAAIAGVGSVRSGIEAGLAREGAALLGGDAEMRFTYRYASEDERDWMAVNAIAVSEIVDFRSMAIVIHDGEAEHGLTQVKAVDAAWPLIGTARLAPDMDMATALAGRDGQPGAVMQRVLIDRLGLQIGDTFRLGTQGFTLMAELTHEPDGAADGFGLGPRTIVALADLGQSGLLSPGSVFSSKYRLDLPDESDLVALSNEVKTMFGESGLRWTDARNGAPGIAQFVERLGAFLILVGLSGLVVGGVGVSAAVRAYLAEKTTVIATLRTLGADRATIFQTYFIQIGVLSALGISIGLVLGGLVPVVFGPIISARLPVPSDFAFYPVPLIEAAIYGLFTALIFTLWPLARTEHVRAATLFRDALSSAPLLPSWRYLLTILACLAALVGLAGWFSGSYLLTILTSAGLIGALAMLALAAMLVRFAARHSNGITRGRPSLRWALAAIGGTRDGAGSVMLSMGLGLSVLAAIGQIDGNLRNAISGNLPEVAPSYFFVDIQKDQMEGFYARLAGDPGVSKVDSAPMLRGMVTRINGRPASEVAGSHWVLDGDRGITYAAELPERTRVTKGKWWAADYSGPPQISFAAEEAGELGLNLGDTISLSILGREITAEITSFREVDFSTGAMGFVLTMNPAALASAPHSFIATVYAEPEAEAAILRDLARQFPNITAIRVRDAIARVSEVLAGLANAVSWAAAASLLTGFLVLIGAAAAGTGARTYEAAVLKTLGASRARILTSFALRAGLMGAAAGLVALLVGISGGWAVNSYVLETSFTVIWPSAIGIVTGGIIATLLAGLGFAWGPLAARPAQVLRSRE
ncbi:MAG: drug:proton antiporter [Rhodobacteraceae bacterium]|nr:drug:proton antiporter [Paracoccaceae bacterium]